MWQGFLERAFYPGTGGVVLIIKLVWLYHGREEEVLVSFQVEKTLQNFAVGLSGLCPLPPPCCQCVLEARCCWKDSQALTGSPEICGSASASCGLSHSPRRPPLVPISYDELGPDALRGSLPALKFFDSLKNQWDMGIKYECLTGLACQAGPATCDPLLPPTSYLSVQETLSAA